MNSLQTLNSLKELSYELSLKAAATLPGEPFEKGYMANKKAFSMLMKSDHHIEKWFTQYFKDLSVYVGNRLNPVAYNMKVQEMKQASMLDDLIQVDWTKEGIKIRVFLIDELIQALQAGSISVGEIPGFPSGFVTTTAQAMKYLQSYSLDLVKGLNNTTKDDINTALQTSISLGENQEAAARRMASVVNSPVRASMIAHTETVRAFNQGRMMTGEQLGATQKEWVAAPTACIICSSINPVIVDFNKNFVSDAGGEFSIAPAHPRCRCLVYPILPKKN